MAVEEVLYARLTGFAGLTALVGEKVYPNRIEQGVANPSLSYLRISSVRESAMSKDIGIVQARFQFDIWADNYSDSVAVKEQVRLALQRWDDGDVIIEVFLEDQSDLYEDDTRTHRVRMDFRVIYRESN